MNKFKKLMCLFLSVLMILSMGIPAFAIDKATDSTSTNETQKTATTTEKNPLTIEISTNKAEYKVTNVAEITATVTNTGKEDIKNVSAEAVFNDLAPVGKKTSETKKEVETLKAGESISFTYKATLNASEHKLNLFQKIFLWFVRLFNGGFTAKDNGFDNGRDVIEQTNTMSFGKFDAVNTVKVWYGENGSISDDEDFTTKLENSHNVDNSIKELSNSNNYKNSTDEQKVSQMRSLLNKLENSGEIKNISYDNYVFSFQYKNGWKGGVVVKDNHSDCYSSLSSNALMQNTRTLLDSYPTVNNISAKTAQNARWTFSIGTTDTCQTMFELKNQYTNLGVPVQVVAPATVDTYKHLSENDFIYIQSHGNLIDNKPWICTSEIAEDRKQERYEGDLDKNTIHIYYTDGIGYFWINPSFFEDNYQVNKLDNTIIYMGSCCSFGIDNIEDYSFYNSFKNVGARTVIGFCNSVNQGYSNYFGEKLLYYLSQGNTVEIAFEKTKNILGKNDNIFWEQFAETNKNPKEFPAYPILRGDKNAKLVDEAMTGFGSFTASIKDSRTKNALENVAVEVYSGSGAELFHLERTDITGIFTIALPEGQYSCTFVKKNYENKSIKFNVQNGIETVWIDPIYMTRQTGEALCAAYDKTTNSPIENVKIEAIDISSKPLISSYEEFKKHEIVATATTGSKGLASLDLPYGSYLLAFTHDNYEYFMKEVEINAELDISAYDVKLTPKGFSGEDDRPVTASGNCGANGDNVKWVLYDDGELVISGQGEMANYNTYPNYSPWHNYKDSITAVAVKYNITSIGDFAFDNLANLKKVTVADSVTSIGYYAFNNCTSLADISLGNSITVIGKSAIAGCTSLESIEIPKSVKNIGERAFGYCISLENIIIPDSVINIENNAFNSCTSLESITIPDSITSISYSTFYNCKSLKNIKIPNSVKNIGKTVFVNCTSLTSIAIPNSVTSIGDGTFHGCTNLTSIIMPDSVISIGACVFENCTSLESITIPDSVTNIGKSAFSNCASLTSIVIPNSVTSISSSTFYNCKSLKNIEIPDSVTSIGACAFENCTSLESITIPDGVTNISYSLFKDCTKLIRIIMSENIISIDAMAFCNCDSLESITINNPNCTIYGGADNISDTATIYGYSGSTAEAYAKKYNREFVAL